MLHMYMSGGTKFWNSMTKKYLNGDIEQKEVQTEYRLTYIGKYEFAYRVTQVEILVKMRLEVELRRKANGKVDLN